MPRLEDSHKRKIPNTLRRSPLRPVNRIRL